MTEMLETLLRKEVTVTYEGSIYTGELGRSTKDEYSVYMSWEGGITTSISFGPTSIYELRSTLEKTVIQLGA